MCRGGKRAYKWAGRPATKHMQRDRTRAAKSITNTQASVSVTRVRKKATERERVDSSPQFEVLVSQLSQLNLFMRHTRAFASSFGTRLTARSDWQPAGCGSDASASCLPCVLRVRSSRAAACCCCWLASSLRGSDRHIRLCSLQSTSLSLPLLLLFVLLRS